MTLQQMTLQRLLISVALPTMILGCVPIAFAQTSIEDDRTTSIETSVAADDGTAEDVTISSTGTITREDAGSIITIDSDNAVINEGTIFAEDLDDVTGVEMQGGNTGSFTNDAAISFTETYEAEDTDEDGIIDGDFAEGTGRTGILISGTSAFVGDVTQSSTGSISVEGNDSYGIRLMETASLQGDLDIDGIISLVGTNVVGIGIEGQVIGDLANSGTITTRGENSQSISVTGDIDGQLLNGGSITNSGYRFTSRQSLTVRELLDEEDLLQAGSAIDVSGDVSNGIFLELASTTTTDDDDVETTTYTSISSVSQFGEAPAILIDGDGTPIAIGMVGTVTDTTDDDYDAELLYAFVQQGSVSAAGIYDDINATAFYVSDATLTGGINNSGTMTATTYRSGDDGTDDVTGQTGFARVIVLGSSAIADEINNSGIILAQSIEATDEIYADADDTVAARYVTATAIDIESDASLSSLTNTGSITAVITARDGEVVAIRDSSGTLIEINNSGQIQAYGQTSDADGDEDTSFSVIAIDVSTNTSGVTITQTAPIDDDLDDDVDPTAASILGNVLLGSGDDTVDMQSGSLVGNLSFGAGADVFNLSGESTYFGILSDSDGDLAISITDRSTLIHASTEDINVTSAYVDGTSEFRPTLSGADGEVSTLIASGTVTLEDGAGIAPVLSSVIGTGSNSFTVIQADTLELEGDVTGLAGIDTPFLYDASYSLDPNDSNTLVVTLDLRSTDELGLDTVQTAMFSSAFEALENNLDLASALVNISDSTEFNSAYNQLLPEFAAASRQYILAGVDGSTGAVGTHLDVTRRSPDRPGGAWIEEFGYYADRSLEGLSEQYRGYGFGFTGGFDTALGPFHAVGVNVGFSATEIEDVLGEDDPMDIVTLQGGLYAGLALGKLGIDAYAGGGYNSFESNRTVEIDDFSSSTTADWDGAHYNASLKAGYDVNFTDKYWMRPTVSVDYLSLTENAYTEDGDLGIALSLDKRTVDVGSATAMMNLGASYMGRRTWVRPSIRAGYRTEFINDPVITTGSFAGLSTPFTITGEDFPDSGFLLGFSIAAGSEFSSFGFDFDSDIRDGFIRHTGRIVFRLLF